MTASPMALTTVAALVGCQLAHPLMERGGEVGRELVAVTARVFGETAQIGEQERLACGCSGWCARDGVRGHECILLRR